MEPSPVLCKQGVTGSIPVTSTNLLGKQRFAEALHATLVPVSPQCHRMYRKRHAFTLADSNFSKPPVSCWTRNSRQFGE
jgi:hypothetical protein